MTANEDCWLCHGLGGVAIHNRATEVFGRPGEPRGSALVGTQQTRRCSVGATTQTRGSVMSAKAKLPEWATEWLPGHCGCGSRLALAACMQMDRHVVCVESGWDIGKCPLSQPQPKETL